MTDRETQFAELYRHARVEDQRAYYERTAARYEGAHRRLLLFSSIVFGLSSTVALLSGIDMDGKRVWAVLAAVLPAVTTAVAAYSAMFSFERVAKLYRDAARNLRRVPPPTFEEGTDGRAAVAAYVAAVERIFDRERGQWGQLDTQRQAEPQQPAPEQQKPDT